MIIYDKYLLLSVSINSVSLFACNEVNEHSFLLVSIRSKEYLLLLVGLGVNESHRIPVSTVIFVSFLFRSDSHYG